MAANNMSSTHLSPDILSILLLLQQGNLYKVNYNNKFCMAPPQAVVQRCSVKKLLLKFTQHSQE